MTIRLVVDPSTGKKNIIVSYHSESDALPIEHEEEHRALVDKLIEGGVIKASEAGKVIVAREEESPVGEVSSTSEGERESVRQKG
jgi:hypothetical protein